jgi:hypothetical protein
MNFPHYFLLLLHFHAFDVEKKNCSGVERIFKKETKQTLPSQRCGRAETRKEINKNKNK